MQEVYLILLFFLFIFSAFCENPYIRHVYLTWQDDSSTTMTINIHSLQDLEQIYLYYDEISSLTFHHHVISTGIPFMEGKKRRWIHHIELKDLKPGQIYQFVVGSPKHGFISEKRFKTIPLNTPTYRFIEGGDWETTPSAALLAKQAASYNPMAVFLGGDYPRGVTSYKDYKKWDAWLDVYTENMVSSDRCLIPMVMAIGNHEVEGGFDQAPEDVKFFTSYFKQNPAGKTYFSRLFGEKIILFVLDSGHTEAIDGPQLLWLKEELKKYAHLPIKLALYHVPIYPSIQFKTPTLFYKAIAKAFSLMDYDFIGAKLLSPQSLQEDIHWRPLFDRYRMTTAFEHHNQTLKRTKLLRDGKKNRKGTLYLGDGGWGPEIQLTPLQPILHSHFAKTIGHLPFFWLVDISKESIDYQAISLKNLVIDRYHHRLAK